MRITQCLADISTWTAAHHLKLNLRRTSLHHWERLSSHRPGSNCRGCHGMAFVNDEEPQHYNITTVTQSCRFALHNIRSIWSFLTKDATQLLVQTLAGLPTSVTKPLQGFQSAAACLIYNPPDFSHVTPPLLCDLHLLPIAARIWLKMMVLAFKNINRTAPVYLQLVGPHAPVRVLRSSTSSSQLLPHRWEQTKLTQRSRNS